MVSSDKLVCYQRLFKPSAVLWYQGDCNLNSTGNSLQTCWNHENATAYCREAISIAIAYGKAGKTRQGQVGHGKCKAIKAAPHHEASL